MTYRTEAEAWLQLAATPHEIAEQGDWSHISGIQGVTFPLVPARAPPRRSRRGDPVAGTQLGCGFPPSRERAEFDMRSERLTSVLRLPRCRRDFMRSRAGERPPKFFMDERNLS